MGLPSTHGGTPSPDQALGNSFRKEAMPILSIDGQVQIQGLLAQKRYNGIKGIIKEKLPNNRYLVEIEIENPRHQISIFSKHLQVLVIHTIFTG